MVTEQTGERGTPTNVVAFLREKYLTTRPRPTALAILTPVDNPAAEVRLEMLGPSVLVPANPRWSEIDRPRRQNVLRWDGAGVARQTFTAMFSGTPGTDGQLADVTTATVRLHALLGTGLSEPPLLRISGPLYGIGPRDRWQLESITPGEPWRRDTDARTAQVTYEVSLAQFLFTDTLVRKVAPPSPAAASNSRAQTTTKAAAATRTYTVRKGDTLSKIAAGQLGNASRWQELAKLNGIRDPKALRVGAVLKLP